MGSVSETVLTAAEVHSLVLCMQRSAITSQQAADAFLGHYLRETPYRDHPRQETWEEWRARATALIEEHRRRRE